MKARAQHALPRVLPFQGYMTYIKNLPINDTPQIIGLHDNANITFAQNETFSMLEGLLLLQPKTSSGSGMTREEVRSDWSVFLRRVENKIITHSCLQKLN